MKKTLDGIAIALLFTLAPGLVMAQELRGSGHTTKTVGNYSNGSILPTGQVITPLATPGSTIDVLSTVLRADGNADAAQAVNTALSPNGRTLLVLTSGWNRSNHLENGTPIRYPTIDPITGAAVGTTTTSEWVFVFAVNKDGTTTKLQQINVPSTYSGLAWAPDGTRFYVSGGQDDRVYVYKFNGVQFVTDTPFILLGHNSNAAAPFPNYDGSILKGTKAAQAVTFGGSSLIVGGAVVAGLAVSRDGRTLVAANFENDSISIVDTATRTVVNEIKFFTPGGTVAQGEFPYDVALVSNDDGSAKTAFVPSQRDDDVMVVDIASGSFHAIPVGDQPNRMTLSKDQRTLYVVNGNSDTVSVIDTVKQSVVRTISLSRPGDKYKGANPNSASLSPDERTLYVTLGFENAVAVVDLFSGTVRGRIPTGWYPTSVSVKPDGSKLYVCTFKSNDGPNPTNGPARNPTFLQARPWPLAKAQLNTIPVPQGDVLEALSEQVDANNGLINRRPDPLMSFLQHKISHVIYIVKENKTYDQVLGDLPRGNGDPSLTQFPQAITPNHHQLAMTFGLLDNFYDSGMVSGDGWGWSTYAETTDYNEKTIAVNYGNGGNGVTYDAEGTTRLIGEGLPDSDPHPSQFTVRLTTLLDPTGSSAILPGTKDVNAPFGSANFQPIPDDRELSAEAVGGHLWDSALRSNKTVRNYGFFVDQAYYVTSQADPTQPDPVLKVYLPVSPTPFASNLPQAVPLEPELRDKTDIYYRGFDMNNADTYLFNEWLRDVTANGLPNLTLLRLPHDHFGSTGTAIAGLRTPSLQIADNDYAIGRVVDFISHSPYWTSTAIFILEDDAQSGGDHVDAHRSLGYVISPYSRRGVTISTNYDTVNVLRTMEDLLGIDHLNQSDANAAAMSDVFMGTPDFTAYHAIVPGSLCASPVDPNLVPACANPNAKITPRIPELHDATWWTEKLKDFNFHDADRLDTAAFNRVLWEGTMGNAPYPAVRSGLDLRKNRAQLLKNRKSTKRAQVAVVPVAVLPHGRAPLASEVSAEKGAENPLPRIERGALMRAAFGQHVDWSHLPKGARLEGAISYPIYAGEHIALPAGTPLRVTISSSGKVRDPRGFWRTVGRTVVRFFNPLEKARAPQYRVTLSSAELRVPTGEWVPAEARAVRAGASIIMNPRRSELAAVEHTPRTKNKPAQILLLQLDKELTLPANGSFLSLSSEPSSMDRSIRAYLLTPLSASESRRGDKFQAQLAEPVRLGDREFKSGSLLEGTVVRRTPPRILSRSGKLYLRMDRVTADTGERLDISGTLSGAEADAQMRFDLDEEGTLRGRKPGLRNGFIDLGISYAVGKSSDDIAETPIRALGASLGDAAVANVARYIGLAGAVTYLVTRHGRDVRLPKYAEIETAVGRVNQTRASARTAP